MEKRQINFSNFFTFNFVGCTRKKDQGFQQNHLKMLLKFVPEKFPIICRVFIMHINTRSQERGGEVNLVSKDRLCNSCKMTAKLRDRNFSFPIQFYKLAKLSAKLANVRKFPKKHEKIFFLNYFLKMKLLCTFLYSKISLWRIFSIFLLFRGFFKMYFFLENALLKQRQKINFT